MKGSVLRKEEPATEGKRQLGVGALATVDSRQQIHRLVSRESSPLEHYVSANAVAAHLSVERRVVLNLAQGPNFSPCFGPQCGEEDLEVKH